MGKVIGYILVIMMILAPWGYHIVYCFKQKEYVLLIAGTVIPPLGWLHGVGASFGWW